MSIIRKIESIFKRNLSADNTNEKVVLSEEEFYTKLFTENPLWNNTSPNEEEATRWKIIEEFLQTVKEFYANKSGETISILDLGCGRGWLTNLLSTHGNVLGVEPVKPVVEYAKKIFPALNFINGTSDKLLRQNLKNKFDLIVSSEVIEHIPNNSKSAFVNDIKELLTDRGFAIITTPRKEVEEEWNKYSGEGQPIEDWVTEEQLKSYFEEQNFRSLSFKKFSIKPLSAAPEIEIYQLWLFQKNP
jgi:SAM-dependent methyltransferase